MGVTPPAEVRPEATSDGGERTIVDHHSTMYRARLYREELRLKKGRSAGTRRSGRAIMSDKRRRGDQGQRVGTPRGSLALEGRRN